MANNPKSLTLNDDDARLTAICAHNRSMLVEAGAGSGKTAVLAGRITLMLAEGVAPRNIAAVTFTELAASELLSRVREFVQALIGGNIAAELRIALQNGLSEKQLANLKAAAAAIDEITCSTIHGFCQRLIKPYPAEADIDPGAAIIDRNRGDLAFAEIIETWLREQLDSASGSLLAELALQTAESTVGLVHVIASALRQRRDLKAPTAPAVAPLLASLEAAVKAFAEFLSDSAASEPETQAIVDELSALMATPRPRGDAMSAGLVWILTAELSLAVLTKEGNFRAYKKKGKWESAAKQVGLSKTEAAQLNQSATDLYSACAEGWSALKAAAAAQALVLLIDQVREVLIRYRDYKRRSAQLDFDDLIYAARDLLRNHDVVRKALGARYAYVLVDEFQDTDPLQTEIFWRLCGDPPSADSPWTDYRIRPGALFLVGDPKQAIYRFRGADVRAYVNARMAFQTQDSQSLLSISTNFRSCRSILTYVNARFEAVLSADGQPGFTALDAFHEDVGAYLAVNALDVQSANEEGNASVEQMRDAEAEAVAELCARLIGHHPVVDRRTGATRPCRPGDIALLAPTGTELWRYEEALESRGIAVATQAGKGFFRRQEIQDLIALTRVLADRRDTLALGALLRGPLVGLTDEEFADLVLALPHSADKPDAIPKLDVRVDIEHITHPLAREVLEKLQTLYRRSNSTTPHEVLSLAVDVLRVRPILLERHRGHAERALANVDLYLSLAGDYAVRGLQAFAAAMRSAWEDEERSVEGRPDAQEESIALFTIHASKGLEWPVVIPINTMTTVKGASGTITDRTGTFYCSILGIAPAGLEEAIEAENVELARERLRLWYVAATRARELLVLPRLDVAGRGTTWSSLMDLALSALPAIDPAQLPQPSRSPAAAALNSQTHESFAREAMIIAAVQPKLSWRSPSRHEGTTAEAMEKEEADIWTAVADEPGPDLKTPPAVQGGRERGLILHKLMEEIVTGELAEAPMAVTARAGELISAFGHEPVFDPTQGLSSEELAACIARTLALPQVAALRSKLQAEFTIYGSRLVEGEEEVMSGIADALTVTDSGKPDIVIDWKSDVQPTQAVLDLYRQQVGAYLEATGAREGLIVLMTAGVVIPVQPVA